MLWYAFFGIFLSSQMNSTNRMIPIVAISRNSNPVPAGLPDLLVPSGESSQ